MGRNVVALCCVSYVPIKYWVFNHFTVEIWGEMLLHFAVLVQCQNIGFTTIFMQIQKKLKKFYAKIVLIDQHVANLLALVPGLKQ